MATKQAQGKPSGLRVWLRRLAPYAIAAIAITAIVHKYPPAKIAEEMQRGELLGTIPYAAVLIATGIFLLAASDKRIFDGFIESPRFLHLARARAALSLLGMIGYGASVGGQGLWLARATSCGARQAGGLMLYVMSTDLIAVSTVAAASIWIGGADIGGALPIAAPVIAVVLLTLKMIGPFQLFDRSKVPMVFKPWGEISRRRALLALALRTINIYWISVCVWAGANAFGMEVPLAVMTVYMPIILVVGSMPVNVGGFGAVQGAWLLLAPYAASPEQVLAFSVLWSLVVASCIALRGLPFLRKVVAEIDSGAPAPVQVQQSSA